MAHFDRRTFLHASLLGAGALSYWPRAMLAQGGPGTPGRVIARPFELSQVRLRPGVALDALNVNRRHLMAYEPDRLLHMFRVTAGLPSSAEPLGGWEAPNNELRGHFTGHYLSACGLMYAQTGDAAMQARGDALVAELAKCQAKFGNGYLSAFPEELFDRLRANQPAWAPFYTLHKIMAGMLDMHVLAGNAQAREVLEGMATWTAQWVRPIDTALMERILEREYGGMNEVLYDFAALTGQDRWRELAERFNRKRIFEPLAAGRDELQGLHVNTTIPQVIGAARGYELTGDRNLHDCADYFWHTVTERRSYCTGGTSNGESWNAPPGKLAGELSGYTQECCVTYNMQKLTRHLFGWTGDARAADYYERAYYNGILGVEHPRDGSKLYYVPLQSGYWKLFGTSMHDFWCCTGSMAEAFSKLGDSIYFKDDDGLYVNLFVPSEVTWQEKGLRIVQETTFPESDRTTLTVRASAPRRAQLRIRVPYWAAGGSASLNGKKLESFATPSSYLVLDRTWRDGDRVELQLPMRLHAVPMPDDPTVQAVMYGPLVLAGKLGTAGLTAENLRAEPTRPRTVPEYKSEPIAAPTIRAPSAAPASWLQAASGRPLEFRTVGQQSELTLVPLNRIFDERYAVYWKVAAAADARTGTI
ncbi:MAG TPA: beta-L-arabinofuranosidase domain-containing protein [Steroidobacteraceae bacterium]|nr:beta-L-arabinofuranosidase domain-containing protein [Steroidobacteraceae bacterium]